MESTNNRTFLPLASGRAYIGSWDTVSAFASATITCVSDTDAAITMFQSGNKQIEVQTPLAVQADVYFSQTINITAPYVYFAVRNSSGTNQNVLAFTVVYHQDYAPPAAHPGTVNSNIFSSSGESIGVSSEALNVFVKNAQVPVEVPTTRAYAKAWDNATVNAGDTSAALALDPFSSRALTVYGVCSAACVLTLQFSPDGLVWYSSASTYTLSGAGDFGWCIAGACPSYARLLITGGTVAAASITAHIEGC